MENRWLIKAGLAIGLALACGYGSAETTRELRDGKYWIDVPAGETYTLAESDVDVLVPDEGAQPELWKIGAGTLEMTTNGLANCAKMMSYNADIYATNGLLRTRSEYALGNYTKNATTEKSQTFIWPGAAYDNGYQRDEQTTGRATGGITQREMIHIAGNGFGDYGALNETVGNHIMIGKVTLDGDARVGKSSKSTQIRYHELNFNGYTITSGGSLGFGSLPVANVPAVPLVISSGFGLTFTGVWNNRNGPWACHSVRERRPAHHGWHEHSGILLGTQLRLQRNNPRTNQSVQAVGCNQHLEWTDLRRARRQAENCVQRRRQAHDAEQGSCRKM